MALEIETATGVDLTSRSMGDGYQVLPVDRGPWLQTEWRVGGRRKGKEGYIFYGIEW